jgi:hypothetical protein
VHALSELAEDLLRTTAQWALFRHLGDDFLFVFVECDESVIVERFENFLRRHRV